MISTSSTKMVVEDPYTGEESVVPTSHLRWLKLNGFPALRLQQLFYVTRHRSHSITQGEPEWRDVPMHIVD